MASDHEIFPTVDRVEVDAIAMAAFVREQDFMALSFGLLREVTSYVCIAACTMGQKATWNRDQAAVGGNMVRLFKVLSAFLDQTMQRRYETTTIFARLAFETIVSVRYLCANYHPDLIDSFVRYSLRHERRLFDTINRNVSERGGTVQPIEQRMLNSLNRAARIAGISLESIDLKDRSPWGGKNLREKAKSVGLDEAYDAAFGGMSHNVHGAWQDLYQFHLNTDDGDNYTPKLDWGTPRPQFLFALGLLSIDAVRSSLHLLGGEFALNQLDERLDDLSGRVQTVNIAHESYLSQKMWPEI